MMNVERQPEGLRALREHPFELLRELERRSRAAAAGAHGDDIEVEEWVGIGFRIADESLVVARDQVKEVLMLPAAVTRVPGAKHWVRGLANVRGHLLPISDLRDFLGAGAGGLERSARVLVTSGPEYTAGLVVDEVYGFRRFFEREFSAEAPAVGLRCGRFLAGGFARGGEVWPVFDLARLMGAEEFQKAAAD